MSIDDLSFHRLGHHVAGVLLAIQLDIAYLSTLGSLLDPEVSDS